MDAIRAGDDGWDATVPDRWLLLIHQLPAEPAMIALSAICAKPPPPCHPCWRGRRAQSPSALPDKARSGPAGPSSARARVSAAVSIVPRSWQARGCYDGTTATRRAAYLASISRGGKLLLHARMEVYDLQTGAAGPAMPHNGEFMVKSAASSPSYESAPKWPPRGSDIAYSLEIRSPRRDLRAPTTCSPSHRTFL
jgi:hypothetical protein